MNGKVVNKHFSALPENDGVTMLYALADGPCEQSYGIAVAKMAGFPPSVVDVAKRKVQELESYDVGGKRQKLGAFIEKGVDAMDAQDVIALCKNIFA